MSNYNNTKLKSKPVLDKDLILAWNSICNKLGREGSDFHLISKNPKNKLVEERFHATSVSGKILIEKVKDPLNHSTTTWYRQISWSEFETLAKFYNEYAKGDSYEIQQTDSQNLPYVITLIADLL
jgi:hypothetical protein